MTRRALPALLLAALGAAGCYSDPATGAIRFGRRPAGPTPDQVAIQRLQSENEELRTELRNLRFQVDGVGSSMSSVAARRPEPSPSVRSGNGYEYVIKRGDTLSDIARDFHVSVRDIMTANNISDASRIREGQTIFVPAN